MRGFDIYISVGEACRPAMHLVSAGLRKESFPLDWQMEYSLESAINLFETSFNSFFKNIKEDETKSGSGGNRWVEDVSNHITSIHHFPKSIEIEEAQKTFIEKMQRRYHNLELRLKEAESIAFICNRTDSLDELKKFLCAIDGLYPGKEITLINIRTDVEMDSSNYKEETIRISDNENIIEYQFNDTLDSETGKKYDPRGNDKIWTKILSNYCLTSELRIIDKMREHSGIVLYGAGNNCKKLINKLERHSIVINGIAVTNLEENPSLINNYKVRIIEDYPKDSLVVITLINKEIAEEVKNYINDKGYNNTIVISDSITSVDELDFD